ncbi:MAG: DUF4276 family protein [Chloroflexota bacterium]|nr:DUF4276 family protein [Chloroflexota bacterium]
MNTIVFGFYGEGARDYGFIQPLVERLLNEIIPHVDIFAYSIKIEKEAYSLVRTMLEVAKAGYGYSLIIFHQDADASDTQKCLSERFQPRYETVKNTDEQINKTFVPIIPVRMTEAWMLVDFEAFKRVTGTDKNADDLEFPNRPHQVEALQEPKFIFEQAVRKSRNSSRRRRRMIDPSEIYVPLAAQIDLERLRLVPSFHEFETGLKDILQQLHYMEI